MEVTYSAVATRLGISFLTSLQHGLAKIYKKISLVAKVAGLITKQGIIIKY